MKESETKENEEKQNLWKPEVKPIPPDPLGRPALAQPRKRVRTQEVDRSCRHNEGGADWMRAQRKAV